MNRRRLMKLGVMSAISISSVVRNLSAATAKRDMPPVDLDFLKDKMNFHARDEWTDVQPKPWRLRTASIYSRITVHHSGETINYHTSTEDIARDLDGVLTSHLDRNYGDIGYHFVIDYSGSVWEGRSLAYEGAHVSSQNEENIGIMFLGNFEEQEPSVKQIESLNKIIDVLRSHYGIKKYRVYGHRDLGHTLCPGNNLYANVQQLKA